MTCYEKLEALVMVIIREILLCSLKFKGFGNVIHESLTPSFSGLPKFIQLLAQGQLYQNPNLYGYHRICLAITAVI